MHCKINYRPFEQCLQEMPILNVELASQSSYWQFDLQHCYNYTISQNVPNWIVSTYRFLCPYYFHFSIILRRVILIILHAVKISFYYFFFLLLTIWLINKNKKCCILFIIHACHLGPLQKILLLLTKWKLNCWWIGLFYYFKQTERNEKKKINWKETKSMTCFGAFANWKTTSGWISLIPLQMCLPIFLFFYLFICSALLIELQ